MESLARKYEEKYKHVAELASKLAVEEAAFRDVQVSLHYTLEKCRLEILTVLILRCSYFHPTFSFDFSLFSLDGVLCLELKLVDLFRRGKSSCMMHWLKWYKVEALMVCFRYVLLLSVLGILSFLEITLCTEFLGSSQSNPISIRGDGESF